MRLFSTLNVSLAWCVISYYFLGRAEVTGSILASMAAITTASIGRSLQVSGMLVDSPVIYRPGIRYDPAWQTSNARTTIRAWYLTRSPA